MMNLQSQKALSIR